MDDSFNDIEDRIEDTLKIDSYDIFASQARITTEGMCKRILIKNGVLHSSNSVLQLGNMFHDFPQEIKSIFSPTSQIAIHQVRLIGNRASHDSDVSITENEFKIARRSFAEIVRYFYSYFNRKLSFLLNRKLNAVLSESLEVNEFYESRTYLFAKNALLENSPLFPNECKRLVNNILKDILIDNYGKVPSQLYYKKGNGDLNINNVLKQLEKDKIVKPDVAHHLLILFNFFLESRKSIGAPSSNEITIPISIKLAFDHVVTWRYPPTNSKEDKKLNLSMVIMELAIIGLSVYVVYSWFTNGVVSAQFGANKLLAVAIIAGGMTIFIGGYSYHILQHVFSSFRNHALVNFNAILLMALGIMGTLIAFYTFTVLLGPEASYRSNTLFLTSSFLLIFFMSRSMMIAAKQIKKQNFILKLLSYVLTALSLAFGASIILLPNV